MSGLHSRNKGKRAEREVVKLIQPLVDRAFTDAGRVAPLVQRNTIQSHVGGADLVGVPFLAIEVKHCEIFCLPAWWRQTCEQMDGRLPLLFYRKNHVEFRCRVVWAARMPVNDRWATDDYSDVDLWLGLLWLYWRLCEFTGAERKKAFEESLIPD